MTRKDEYKWVMVRLYKADHQALTEFRDRAVAYAREHPEKCPPWLCLSDVGLSLAVRELLRRVDEHAARSRTSHQRRLKRKSR